MNGWRVRRVRSVSKVAVVDVMIVFFCKTSWCEAERTGIFPRGVSPRGACDGRYVYLFMLIFSVFGNMNRFEG